MPRIYCPTELRADMALALPEAAAKHVQVLRLQAGDALTLFNGQGGQYTAEVTRMHKHGVDARVLAHEAIECETPHAVHLALGMPANERMDWLVEKATELGAASITPLMSARTVVRLQGERAAKRVAHWQSIAISSAEQCGRNRVPIIYPVQALSSWLQGLAAPTPEEARWLLGFAPGAATASACTHPLCILSGPEGGLTDEEEQWAQARGFSMRSLGPRVLRAETAALSALSRATYPQGFAA